MNWEAIIAVVIIMATTSASGVATTGRSIALHWFRKGLRLHDCPALLLASQASVVYPVFVMDPHFARPTSIGINRYAFLLQSLVDLDTSLRKMGSRLFVVRGQPEDQIPLLVEMWGASVVTFESDTSPFSKTRDEKITSMLRTRGVDVKTVCSHTIFDPEQYIAKCKGNIPSSYGSFCKLFESLGPPRGPCESLSALPPCSEEDATNAAFDVPSLVEMGYEGTPSDLFPGGETAALLRLHQTITSRPDWVAKFEKPNTIPNSLEPSTTVLSPYLKFGCLSASTMFREVTRAYEGRAHSAPPVSLIGQLLWREFFYLHSYTTPNFSKMKGNPRCKQIPWGTDDELLRAWAEARTGYPFIDAIMTQLRLTGWIHHLARHAVACFLTRGDLWQSWEQGARIFDLYLLDADWALNNANWQWLSCSNFFYQYFRCYSPVAFGKKSDPSGDYIRKWIPQLAAYPTKYIYEPWKAPVEVQRQCGCVVGKDYPRPIVDHDVVSKENMARMKKAYEAQREEDTSSSSLLAVGESATAGGGATKKRGRTKEPPDDAHEVSGEHASGGGGADGTKRQEAGRKAKALSSTRGQPRRSSVHDPSQGRLDSFIKKS